VSLSFGEVFSALIGAHKKTTGRCGCRSFMRLMQIPVARGFIPAGLRSSPC